MAKSIADKAERFEEVYEALVELVEECRELVSGTKQEQSANAYWLAQLRIALNDEHGYLGSASTTMADTMTALQAEAEDTMYDAIAGEE